MRLTRHLALPALLALTLAGCGGSNNSTPSSSGSGSAAQSGAGAGDTQAVQVGVHPEVNLPDDTDTPGEPVTVRVPGWNLSVQLAKPSTTGVGPLGDVTAPAGGTFVKVAPDWDDRRVVGYAPSSSQTPETLPGNALDPKTRDTPQPRTPSGVTVAVAAAGKTYPVPTTGAATVVAIPVPADQATLHVTFQEQTQKVNLGTGKREPNPVTDALYADTPATSIPCPDMRVTDDSTQMTGGCTVTTYPVAWSETKGWAPAGKAWQRVTVTMSGTLSLIFNGKANIYTVTPAFTNPTMDGAKPVTGPSCPVANSDGTVCSYLFEQPAGKRPQTIKGDFVLSGPVMLRSDAAAPAIGTHTTPVTVPVPTA